ncbi:hypothetical protein MRX96_042350 [Rhipicephalus microplus]
MGNPLSIRDQRHDWRPAPPPAVLLRAFRSGLAVVSLGAAHQPAHRARCQGRQAASHSRKGRHTSPAHGRSQSFRSIRPGQAAVSRGAAMANSWPIWVETEVLFLTRMPRKAPGKRLLY